ncbi:MAG: hypothetical protein WD025_00200 [Bacteriovoracaceae bacterium]
MAKVMDPFELNNFFSNKTIVFFGVSKTVKFQVKRVFFKLNINPQVSEEETPEGFLKMVKSNRSAVYIIENDNYNSDIVRLGKLLRELSPPERPLVFLLSNTTSKERFFKLAQDHIEALVLKPISFAKMLRVFSEAAQKESLKDQYYRHIALAKSMVLENKLEEAIDLLEDSLSFSRNGALSHCCIGEIYKEQKEYLKALHHFFNALERRPYHYRSLANIFNLFQETNRPIEAYQALKKILSLYPAEPKELCQAFHLCIQNGNFEDMEKLFSMYFQHQERDKELDRYASAAITTFCLHLIETGAIDSLQKHILSLKKTKTPRTPYFKKIIFKLRKHGRGSSIGQVLELFDEREKLSIDYKMCLYAFYSSTKTDDFTLKYSITLVEQGARDELLYRETIKRLKKLGQKEEAEKLKVKAMEVWPSFKP